MLTRRRNHRSRRPRATRLPPLSMRSSRASGVSGRTPQASTRRHRGPRHHHRPAIESPCSWRGQRERGVLRAPGPVAPSLRPPLEASLRGSHARDPRCPARTRREQRRSGPPTSPSRARLPSPATRGSVSAPDTATEPAFSTLTITIPRASRPRVTSEGSGASIPTTSESFCKCVKSLPALGQYPARAVGAWFEGWRGQRALARLLEHDLDRVVTETHGRDRGNRQLTSRCTVTDRRRRLRSTQSTDPGSAATLSPRSNSARSPSGRAIRRPVGRSRCWARRMRSSKATIPAPRSP